MIADRRNEEPWHPDVAAPLAEGLSTSRQPQEELGALVGRPTEEAGLVRRARVILLSERGVSGREIALRLDLSPEHVSKVRTCSVPVASLGFGVRDWDARTTRCPRRPSTASFSLRCRRPRQGAVGGRRGSWARSWIRRAVVSPMSSGRTASSRTWFGRTRSVAIRSSPRR